MKKNVKIRIRLAFVLGVAIILLITFGILVITGVILVSSKAIEEEQLLASNTFFIISVIAASLIIGITLAAIYGRIVSKPIDNLLNGMVKLSKGEYSARINLGKYEEISKVSNMFNNLASELEHTKLLREDFINSFSHEFKTPIASIKGLIELLKKDNLSKEKRKTYLEIIEYEMDRLLEMTTNILNLSKIENQNVLMDIEKINISEQIRRCILLLNKKWEKKNLNLILDFEEYYIHGNIDLLENVWLNLLDNAIKFSNENGEIKIELTIIDDKLSILIENTGSEIAEDDQNKIFDKFYQVDTTHSKEGNGIGLSIVKKIIDLHLGTIDVFSKDNKTAFIIYLPLNDD